MNTPEDTILNVAAIRAVLANVITASESVQPGNPFGDIGHAAHATALADKGLREFDTGKARDIVARIDAAVANDDTAKLNALAAAIPTLLDPVRLLAGIAGIVT